MTPASFTMRRSRLKAVQGWHMTDQANAASMNYPVFTTECSQGTIPSETLILRGFVNLVIVL